MRIFFTTHCVYWSTSQREELPPTTVVSCELVQSVSCLDAIIYQANQVNRGRNDQCVNAHGLADVAQTNWQRLEQKKSIKKEKKERQRERERVGVVGGG